MSDQTPETETENIETRYSIPDETGAWSLAERVCWHIMEKKGEDVLVMDLRGRSDVCDFFVVASGKTTS